MKTDTEIIVGGRVFVISGYESEEYLQKVGTYINNKLTEYLRDEGFKRLTPDYQNLLLEINMADDYFKAKYQIALLEDELKAREDELCNIKHELISTQMKLENLEKALQSSKDEATEKDKKLIRLETELKERDKK